MTVTDTHFQPGSKRRRYLGVIFAYLVCVGASAIVAGTWLTFSGDNMSEFFVPAIFIASAYALVAGLPGFLLTLLASFRLRLTSPLFFAFAGGFNAIVALLLVTRTLDSSFSFDLGVPSIAGGIAGGVVYWAVARSLKLLPAAG